MRFHLPGLAAVLTLAAGPAPGAAPFAVGETLVYDARIGMLPAGSATTSVSRLDHERGQAVYVFAMTGSGGPPGLRMEYAMTSWTGVEPFTSRRFHRRAVLPGHVEDATYEIVPDSLRYRELGGRDWIAPAAPLDELALLYFLRTMSLAPGEARALRGYFKNGYNPLDVRALGFEPVALGRGTTLRALHLRITAAGTTSDVWLSDDARRLPVQLDLPLSIGRVRLILR